MLRLPTEPLEPGSGPFRATPAPTAAVAHEARDDHLMSPPLRALIRDAMFDPADAVRIINADKVVIDGNWFCRLSGDLAGGPVNLDGSLDFSACCVIDMPDVFEHPALIRQAERMLAAAAIAASCRSCGWRGSLDHHTDDCPSCGSPDTAFE